MFFLIGHRGVGKTSLIKKLKNAIDLDEVIENKHGVQKIFSEKGEKAFRDIERRELECLIKKKFDFISLGAGFELKNFDFPENSKFIWIQRDSDLKGRIFLNRPRLDLDLGPLEEFFHRAYKRDPVFKELYDFRISLEEGDLKNLKALRILESLKESALLGENRGCFTPSNELELEVFKGDFELRTDVFSKETIIEKLAKIKHQKTLVSIRTENALNLDFIYKVIEHGAIVDFPLEYKESMTLIDNFSKEQVFVSLHEKRGLDEIKQFINDSAYHLKWAPVINSLDELIECDSLPLEQVSFLPRSAENDGRYKWYRLLRKNRIEFYRYGLSEHLDQPLYFESYDFQKKNIGAVIGEDTFLSWSPFFHRDSFKTIYLSTYLNVLTKRDEFQKTLEFAEDKGVRFFSVTSPFKKEAAEFLGLQGQINTLDLEKKWV